MAEETKPEAGENQNPDNQTKPEETPAQTDYQKQLEEERAARAKAEADAAAARADVSKYQSEADKAKSLLGDKEKLDMQREAIASDAHNLYKGQIERDFPEVYEAYGDTFDSLRGTGKDEYVKQAQYLQAGLDKIKSKNAPKEEKKEEKEESNKLNNAPAPIPAAGQDKGYEGHIFTRAELQEHRGEISWFEKNQAEIDKQVSLGLVR